MTERDESPFRKQNLSRRSFLGRTGGVSAAGIAAAYAPGVGVSSAHAQIQAQTQAQTPRAATSSPGKLFADRFDYSPSIDRLAIKWPNDARVAVWVAPNMEWYEYTPQSRPTAPDIASYSYRDYGNRAGFWRMLEITDKHDIRCCVCLNGAVLEHCPEVRDAMVKRNWDYMAHGFYNTRPITAYSIDEERAYWTDMIATVKKYTGKQLKGRLGAGGGNTVNTPDLMAEFGLTYHTDWLADDEPFPLKVKNNAKFIHVPYTYQLNDAIVPGQGRDAAYFAQMIKDQFDVLYEEGATSGKVMCISLHPFWIGKPHRAKYLDEALAYIRSFDQVWHTTADDIADYYLENHYAAAVAYTAQQKKKGMV